MLWTPYDMSFSIFDPSALLILVFCRYKTVFLIMISWTSVLRGCVNCEAGFEQILSAYLHKSDRVPLSITDGPDCQTE